MFFQRNYFSDGFRFLREVQSHNSTRVTGRMVECQHAESGLQAALPDKAITDFRRCMLINNDNKASD